MDAFDLIVIGAGPGGYAAAIRAAQKGLRTAIIENGDAGGTCLNRGCIPTKALLHSAHLYHQLKSGERFGITGCNEIGFDFEKINERKNDVVRQIRTGTERLLKSNKVTFIRGRAVIKDAHVVSVGRTEDDAPETAGGDANDLRTENIPPLELRAEHIIIAAGSKPNRLPASMHVSETVLTSDEALAEHAALYKRILIVGGGVIGVEFAGIYNNLGCEVTVIDSLDKLIGRMDPDISANLAKLFTKRGIKVMTRVLLQSIEKTEKGLICGITPCGGTDERRSAKPDKEIEVDCVLVCVGRSPVTDCVWEIAGVNNGAGSEPNGQEAAARKIKRDERGFIMVDEFMRTGVPNIYAVGDCSAGSPQLAHSASAQGINAVSHILGEKPPVNMNAVPVCVYSDPEIAAVGLSVSEAEALGIEVKIGRYLMSGNGKSIITDEERGFVKLVFDAETNVLLGAHLMCARATDMIGELANAVAGRQTAEDLASVIRPHPTYAEGVTEAVESVFGLSVHTEKSALPVRKK